VIDASLNTAAAIISGQPEPIRTALNEVERFYEYYFQRQPFSEVSIVNT